MLQIEQATRGQGIKKYVDKYSAIRNPPTVFLFDYYLKHGIFDFATRIG